jgi:GMP synthase-like glutamine amidotransferase
MQYGPIVSVSHPGSRHSLTIGMTRSYPLAGRSNPSTRGGCYYSRPVRVLSVTHGPSVPGGVFDEVVTASGHELVRWVVPAGGAPGPATGYDAVMAFGGSMHPDEDERYDWLEREELLLREALAEDVPAVGVCLGAQMLARAAGAPIGLASTPEIGWLAVELTAEGRADPVLGVLPPRFEAFQWHHYAFETPAGGTELARSEVCAQAFRVGRAWGLQFHAEVTSTMIRAWAGEDPEDLPFPEDELLAATASRIGRWNELGRRLCAAFLAAAVEPVAA